MWHVTYDMRNVTWNMWHNYKYSLLSLHMKTKVVQHVLRINISMSQFLHDQLSPPPPDWIGLSIKLWIIIYTFKLATFMFSSRCFSVSKNSIVKVCLLCFKANSDVVNICVKMFGGNYEWCAWLELEICQNFNKCQLLSEDYLSSRANADQDLISNLFSRTWYQA